MHLDDQVKLHQINCTAVDETTPLTDDCSMTHGEHDIQIIFKHIYQMFKDRIALLEGQRMTSCSTRLVNPTAASPGGSRWETSTTSSVGLSTKKPRVVFLLAQLWVDFLQQVNMEVLLLFTWLHHGDLIGEAARL